MDTSTIPTVATRTPWVGPPRFLLEPKRGYRFRPESTLISELVGPGTSRILDLGAGCGVVGLSAAAAAPNATVTLVERNPVLAGLARENLAASPTQGDVVEADLRDTLLDGPYDLIVTNPPYFRPGSGQPSRAQMVREATHAHYGDVEAFVRIAASLLSDDGALWVVFPADALTRLTLAIHASGLSLREVVAVFARHKQDPFRVWCRAAHTPGPLVTRQLSAWTSR